MLLGHHNLQLCQDVCTKIFYNIYLYLLAPELTPPTVPRSLGRGDLLKLIQTKPRMPHTTPPTSLAPPPHIAMSQMTLQSTTTPPTLINDPQASTYSPPIAAPLNNGATKQGTSGSRLVPTTCALTISINYYII